MVRPMTTVLQIEAFACKPFRDTTITEVPGVGPKLKEKLVAAGIKKPSDLYQRFLKCGGNKEKFRCWITKEVSSRARVPTMYAAFEAWHKQFSSGTPLQQEHESRNDEIETPIQPILGKRTASSAAKRRRSSVQFNITSFEEKSRTTPKEAQRNRDNGFILDDASSQPGHPLIKFLGAMSTVFKNIPEEYHGEFRRDVLALADKYEDKIKSKERQREAQPSTSQTSYNYS